MAEQKHPLDFLDTPTRILKRAQYEALQFELFETNVLVRNESHADPENHEYLVVLEDGLPVSCTCPADEHYDNACKHRVAVAMRRPILDFAREAKLVADGGSKTRENQRGASFRVESDADQKATTEDADNCDCDDLPDEFPCWECYLSSRRESRRLRRE